MKAYTGLLITWIMAAGSLDSRAEGVSAEFRKHNDQGEVRIHSQLNLPVSSIRSEYMIYRSTNMVSWEPAAGPIAGGAGVSDEVLRQAVPLVGDKAFYRVAATPVVAQDEGKLGSSIYGFETEFNQQLQSLGQLSPGAFATLYSPPTYLGQLSFSPTAAEYWTNFSANTSFELNAEELEIFQTNGFVISQRLGSFSTANLFYRIFTADLPVYVSSDAVLQAWHRSYIAMLEELEESYLAPALEKVLLGMNNWPYPLSLQAAGTPMEQGVKDADHFIAVALSLYGGTTNPGTLGQRSRIEATLNAIQAKKPATVELFGTNRTVDFSQFTVRGHYETSTRLSRYFQTIMWCGLADFRFTGATNDNSLRELSGAVAMHLALKNSNQYANWKLMDDVIQMFVGPPDALNFAQLNDLMTAAGVQSPADLATVAALEGLRHKLMSGVYGVQQIQSGYFWSPLSREQLKLPRSFAVMPTRFTVDGWAQSKCVYDRIIWDEDGVPNVQDKVMRRVPSALDIAFAVMANNQVTPLVVERILNQAGHPWRDGLNYQHNLAAVRETLDSTGDQGWTNCIYQDWLGCLRELSGPTTGVEYPETMRTRAWAMKTLNTQLASWTQLRHDTVLYAKQPYTANVLCSYPKGFVEPRTGFWRRMGEMAERTRQLMATLPKTGKAVFEPNPGGNWMTNTMGALYTNRVTFLENFTSTMETLRSISEKELARQELSTNEIFFLESVIENPAGYSGEMTYSGWYPKLFYKNTRALHSGMFSAEDHWDALVTDVHTDPTDPLVGDPGCILHEGVGNVAEMRVAIQWGPGDACVYSGPVLTHYEFEEGPTTRKTDSQWRTDVKAGNMPPLPEWTRGFTVPGNISYYPPHVF